MRGVMRTITAAWESMMVGPYKMSYSILKAMQYPACAIWLTAVLQCMHVCIACTKITYSNFVFFIHHLTNNAGSKQHCCLTFKLPLCIYIYIYNFM